MIARGSDRGWIFAGRIQKAMIGRDRQEGGIANLGSQFRLGKFAGCRTKPADIDTFTMTFAGRIAVQDVLKSGVGAGVQKVFLGLPCGGAAGTKHERKGTGENGR